MFLFEFTTNWTGSEFYLCCFCLVMTYNSDWKFHTKLLQENTSWDAKISAENEGTATFLMGVWEEVNSSTCLKQYSFILVYLVSFAMYIFISLILHFPSFYIHCTWRVLLQSVWYKIFLCAAEISLWKGSSKLVKHRYPHGMWCHPGLLTFLTWTSGDRHCGRIS